MESGRQVFSRNLSFESTPAYEKAIPSKVWEYWALGLPVVVSGLYELSSLVRNVDAGFVLEDRKILMSFVLAWK